MSTHRGRTRTVALAFSFSVAAATLVGCGQPVDLPPGYAIVYGVSDYAGTGNDLTYPDDDADDIASLLEEQGYAVIARTNAAATKSQIVADFQTVAGQAEPDSRFFFYFAGHGFGDGMDSQYAALPESWKAHFSAMDPELEPGGAGNYAEYLFLYHATPITDDVEASLAESLSDDELATLVASVPSRQRVVVIDACHSGGFVGSGSSYDTVPRGFDGEGEGISIADVLGAMTLHLSYDATSYQDVAEQEAIVISAAGEQEFSYESSIYGNGVFTYYFLQAPSAADRNYDGLVTAGEAYAFARAAIASVENEHFSGEAKFLPRVSGGAVDYVLFRAR